MLLMHHCPQMGIYEIRSECYLVCRHTKQKKKKKKGGCGNAENRTAGVRFVVIPSLVFADSKLPLCKMSDWHGAFLVIFSSLFSLSIFATTRG